MVSRSLYCVIVCEYLLLRKKNTITLQQPATTRHDQVRLKTFRRDDAGTPVLRYYDLGVLLKNARVRNVHNNERPSLFFIFRYKWPASCFKSKTVNNINTQVYWSLQVYETNIIEYSRIDTWGQAPSATLCTRLYHSVGIQIRHCDIPRTRTSCNSRRRSTTIDGNPSCEIKYYKRTKHECFFFFFYKNVFNARASLFWAYFFFFRRE